MHLRSSYLFHHNGGPNHIETSPCICSTNQQTGFYIIGSIFRKSSILFNKRNLFPMPKKKILLLEPFVLNIFARKKCDIFERNKLYVRLNIQSHFDACSSELIIVIVDFMSDLQLMIHRLNVCLMTDTSKKVKSMFNTY